MSRAICVHQVHDLDLLGHGQLPGFQIIARTQSRHELAAALGTLDFCALIVDLDNPDGLHAIIETVERKPRLGIIGVTGNNEVNHVIAAQRAGCRQITTRPLDVQDLVAALERALDGEGSEPAKLGRTFGVLGTIGGAGSTTLVSHLAVELAELTKLEVAVMDMDFDFGGVARAFDLAPRYTIADVASAGAVDEHLIEQVSTKVGDGLRVMARPNSIPEAQALDQQIIENLIKVSRQRFPLVLFDLPRKLDPIVGFSIENCEKLLLVLQLTVPSLDNAKRLLSVLQQAGLHEDRVEIVVNRFRKGSQSCTIELAEQELKRKILAVVPSDYHTVHTALDYGRPLAKKSAVRTAIAELAAKLYGQTASPRSGGWWANLGLRRRTDTSVTL